MRNKFSKNNCLKFQTFFSEKLNIFLDFEKKIFFYLFLSYFFLLTKKNKDKKKNGKKNIRK